MVGSCLVCLQMRQNTLWLSGRPWHWTILKSNFNCIFILFSFFIILSRCILNQRLQLDRIRLEICCVRLSYLIWLGFLLIAILVCEIAWMRPLLRSMILLYHLHTFPRFDLIHRNLVDLLVHVFFEVHLSRSLLHSFFLLLCFWRLLRFLSFGLETLLTKCAFDRKFWRGRLRYFIFI